MFHVDHWAAQKLGAPAAVCGQGLRDVKGVIKARASGRTENMWQNGLKMCPRLPADLRPGG